MNRLAARGFRYAAVLAIASLLLASVPAAAAGYRVIGWNNLGMHCMDADFSVLTILPPFNTIHAQVIAPSGALVEDPAALGIVVTFEAIADAEGSINTTSGQGKTNFWDWVEALFGAAPPVDHGLAGANMPGPGNAPQPMNWDAGAKWFVAPGIPITPYDDAGRKNTYPMMRIVVRTTGGVMLAATDIVLPVSDEMDCRTCHTSAAGTPAPGMPAGGWSADPDPERAMRLDILAKHDELQAANPAFAAALAALAPQGYSADGLVATVTDNATPILCANCHASEALGTGGQPNVTPLTRAMHGGHADVVDPLNGLALDSADDRSACYRCHPGSETRCLRGVMGAAVAADGSLAIQCQNCHGSMSTVGAPTRIGWLDEPTCQSCHTGTATHHNGAIRYTSVFDAPGHVRQAVDATFATNPDTPLPGLSLYRFSSGHGGLACEACHGATHAEYPATHANDNVQSIALQGHAGALVECGSCHGGTAPATVNGGPHGMHPVGQAWVRDHHEAIGEQDTGACRDCHGVDYRGTVLSRAKASRTLSGEAGTIQTWPGFQIGCYGCHRGPTSDDPNPNRAAIVTGASVATPAGMPVAVPLGARDPDGDPLTLRIVSQPSHGTTGLAGTVATYIPDAGFVGTDVFTFAAWDGSIDSNLGSIVVHVGGSGGGAGTPIAGARLLIKDRAVGPTTSIVFQSKDAAATTAGVDPRLDGAYLHVFNSAGGTDSACFHLAGPQWRLSRNTFRYKDAEQVASPVKTATFKDGRLQITANGKGPLPITYRLGEPSQGSVGVIFTSGDLVLCANFGGTVTKDSGTNPPNPGGKGQFAARNAPPPGSCPTPPDTCP